MSYALATLWYERQRFLSAILAVTFSALLIALQCGLLLGLFSITSLPIDRATRADIWVTAPGVVSVDIGRPIRESHLGAISNYSGIERAELFIQGFAYWQIRDGGNELCVVIGSRLADDPLGCMDVLTPEMRLLLEEPNAVILDEADLHRVGINDPAHAVGARGEIAGRTVRVVGLTRGFKGLAAPYVLCSFTTAQRLLRMPEDQTIYILARCTNHAEAPALARQMHEDLKESVSVYTSSQFSWRSQIHWLTRTKAGIAMGYAAALGLLVGAVVTSQTLYASTLAALREFAVLAALGIPRWRMATLVVAQSFWIGIIGVGLAWGATHAASAFAVSLGAIILLPWWLQGMAAGVTLGVALVAGLLALRSLRLVEPAILLR
jgi:putative ABC transport system permease protein